MTRMKIIVMAFFLTCTASSVHAQQLSKKDESIVTISAFTAKGELLQLQKALNSGLDAGLTVNEIKEVIIQLYAYAGFPRSLNALNTFNVVLKERKSKGINDAAGKEASPIPANTNKLKFGTAMQTKLVGQPVKGEVYTFAPAIDRFLKEHLFGDIFGRDNLDWKTRELATISALSVLGGVENQLRSHINVGMYNGITPTQLNGIAAVIKSSVGDAEATTIKEMLQEMIFPKGEKIVNNNFAGNAWLHQMILPDSLNPTQVGSVTFEPGARTKWHLHPGGQILLIIDGAAYYQEKGSAKRILKKGEVVKCPPDVPHWHGATKDEGLVQIAITNANKGATVWLENVTDEEYTAPPTTPKMVRLAKITIDSSQLESYKALLKEEIETSLKVEPGVLTLYAVFEKDRPTHLTILEMYADSAAYKAHIKTPHFLKYKNGTQTMVKELELVDTNPLLPALKIK